MRLNRLSILLAAVVLGCSQSTAPALPANYMLVSVNGRPLPAIISPIPEAPTVLDGALFLDGSGKAVVREHQRVMIAPGDVTYTTNYTYTIKDNKIQFHIDCPLDALCMVPPTGTFVGTHLLVDMSAGTSGLVYDYMLLMPD